MKALLKLLALALVLVVALAAFAFAAPAHADDMRYEISVQGSPYLGAKDAPITIIEFMDYQCPQCAVASSVTQRLLEDYKGDVKLVLKMYPYLHKDFSHLAAEAALAAWDQGYLEEMHNMMLQNSPRLDKASLIQYALKAGMDADRFQASLEGMKHMDIIERDTQLAQDLDLYSTPVFFINGKKYIGSRPYEYFKKVVDDELVRLKRQ